MPRVSTVEIESVIRSLTSIMSASVVANSSGSIEEVHVLTDTARAPKQVVRDVESAVIAKFGLKLDHKKISVAQTNNKHAKIDISPRILVHDVSISLNGIQAKAVVRLNSNDQIYCGEASGHSSSHNQLRLISNATLKAIENWAGEDVGLMLEDVNPSVTLSGKNIVVVFINLVTHQSEEFLSGSAVVKQDKWKAVVNATLDAINRRIGLIAEKQG